MPVRRLLQVPRTAAETGPPAGLSAWLLRPYLDLGPAGEHAPIHAVTTHWAGRLLLADSERPLPMQINTDSCFRELLHDEIGPDCALEDPREVPAGARSRPWSELCRRVDAWPELSPARRANLAVLLNRLGFFTLTRELLGAPDDAAPWSSAADAELHLLRLNSLFKVDRAAEQPVVAGLERLASAAPEPRLRLRVTLALIVHFARVRPKTSEIDGWCEVAARELACLRPESDLCDLILRSAFHRAVAFQPFVRGDRPRLLEVMRACEQDALGALEQAGASGDPVLVALARENLHPVWETVAKVAEWAGDPERSLDYRRRFVQLDPGDPKGYVRLGDALLKRGRVEEARFAFHQAADLGAPFSAQAWFMAGLCHERTGDLEGALDAYLCAAGSGPFELEAVKRVAALSARLGQSTPAAWSRAHESTIRGWIRTAAAGPSPDGPSLEDSTSC